MRIEVRLRREFFETTVADLRRPHPVAYERVGWIFAKQTVASTHDILLFAVDYAPVADEHYLEDSLVGASFNATAIRTAMQRSRATGLACLQVHLHDHHGHTGFSSVDIQTIDKLAGSFRVVAPKIAHGGIVLSQDSATSRVWLPEMEHHTPSRATILGFPMRFGPRS